MKRGEVIEQVSLMPMKIKLQREGDNLVAVMPAWQLPFGLMVERDNYDDALEALRLKMYEYWYGSTNTGD